MARPQNKNRNSGFDRVLQGYKRGAKTRGFTWRLSEKEFYDLTQEPCAYCGVKYSNSVLETLREFDYNGVDRVNNEEGYYIDNCVPCCFECNKMKMQMPIDKFLKKVEDIFYYSSLF